MIHGKTKLSLLCDNDLICQKWHEALQRGKSGAVKSVSSKGRVLKLREVVEVEEIPEYSEEDEMRDEGLLPSLSASGVDSGIYITAESLAALAKTARGAVTSRVLGNAVYSGSYMSVGDAGGSYMTVECVAPSVVLGQY